MVNDWLARGRTYLAQRSEQERRFLALGGLILLVLLGYGLLYQPMSQTRAKLAERLPGQRAELRLLRLRSAEIERLRGHGGDRDNGSLERRVKASAATFALGASFSRFNPLADGQIQLATRPLANATWIDWLADLEHQGIRVARCRIVLAEPGMASLELTLAGAQR